MSPPIIFPCTENTLILKYLEKDPETEKVMHFPSPCVSGTSHASLCELKVQRKICKKRRMMTKTSIPWKSSLCFSRNITMKMATLMSAQERVTIVFCILVLADTTVKKCKLIDFCCTDSVRYHLIFHMHLWRWLKISVSSQHPFCKASYYSVPQGQEQIMLTWSDYKEP